MPTIVSHRLMAIYPERHYLFMLSFLSNHRFSHLSIIWPICGRKPLLRSADEQSYLTITTFRASILIELSSSKKKKTKNLILLHHVLHGAVQIGQKIQPTGTPRPHTFSGGMTETREAEWHQLWQTPIHTTPLMALTVQMMARLAHFDWSRCERSTWSIVLMACCSSCHLSVLRVRAASGDT